MKKTVLIKFNINGFHCSFRSFKSEHIYSTELTLKLNNF